MFALPIIYLPFFTVIKLSFVYESLKRSIIKFAWVLNYFLLIILSFGWLYSFFIAWNFLSKFNRNFLNFLWVASKQHPHNTKREDTRHAAMTAITFEIYYLFSWHSFKHYIFPLQSSSHLERGPLWDCGDKFLVSITTDRNKYAIKCAVFIWFILLIF